MTALGREQTQSRLGRSKTVAASALSVLVTQRRALGPDSFQNLFEELLGYCHLRHLEDYLSGMVNYLGPDFDQLSLDTAQGPMFYTLWQH